LAAECGGTIGLLLRPARYRGQPTWADVQWLVSPKSKVQSPRSKATRFSTLDFKPWTLDVELRTWQLRVELTRCRGAAGGQVVLLELDEAVGIWREVPDEAAHSLSLPAQLADPASARRA